MCDIECSDDGGEGWYGDTQGRSLKLMREARNGEQASLKRNKGEKRTTKPEPIYIYPESFLILLMGPDLGVVSKGSTRRVQRGVMACYDPGPYHQFSAIFSHFISRSQSLVPHSFPYAPLGPPPNHLTSHLMDHLTILQSTITCHRSAVRSLWPRHHLSLYGLPAHDTLFLDRQLMMELYLELTHHDTPY